MSEKMALHASSNEEERGLLSNEERWVVVEAKALDDTHRKRRNLRWAHIVFRCVAGGTVFILILVIMSHWKHAQAWAMSKDGPIAPSKTDPLVKKTKKSDETRDTTSTFSSIVLTVADDLGYNDMGWASSDMGGCTPFVDEMVSSGIELTRLYASSVCTPSRGSLLTGKYPSRLGLQHWQIEPAESWGLDPSVEMLSEWFQKAGYTTMLCGKWHLGFYATEYTPTSRGFDRFFGFYSGGIDYVTRQALCLENQECFFDHGDDFDQQHKEAHATIEMASVAENWLQEFSDQPTFLYLALPNSHAPVSPPSWAYREFDQCAQPIRNRNRRAFAVLTALWDQALRNVSRTSLSVGSESPVWIVISDNGADPAYGGSNYPLRGAKKYLFEGGVRVRGFIWSPLFRASGSQRLRYSGLFHIADFAPTLISGFLNRADLLPDDLDGVDHWDKLLHPSDDELRYRRQDEMQMNDDSDNFFYPRNELLLGLDYLNSTLDYLGYMRMCIIFCDGLYSCFKAMYNVEQVFWYLPPTDPDTVINPTPTEFRYSALFNLSADPGEHRDLKMQFPDIFQSLQTRILENYKITRAANLPDDFAAYPVWRQAYSSASSSYLIRPWRKKPISNFCLNLTKGRLEFEIEQDLLLPEIDCAVSPS